MPRSRQTRPIRPFFTLALSLTATVLAEAGMPRPAMGGAYHAAPLRSATPLAIPVAVFEHDNRIKLDQSRTVFSAYIGTLRISRSSPICTAVCLAPDIVATASHCLFGTSAAKGPSLTTVTFATADRPSEAVAIAGAATASQRQNVVSGTHQLNVQPPIDAVNDWAIVRLASPVCHKGGLELDMSAQAGPASGAPSAGAVTPTYQIAMHRDLPDTELRFDGPCQMLSTPAEVDAESIARDFTRLDAVQFHRCDTGPGSSGSPMLTDGTNGPRITGINIGTYVIAHAVIGARAGDEQNKSMPVANTAIAARHFAPAAAAFAARPLLATRDEFVTLELRLKTLGLYREVARGRLTPQLETAIAAFETRLGLPQTGIASSAILAAAEAAVERQTAAAMPAFAPHIIRTRNK